ncbi:L-amino acid N-acyltransferase YncA [Rhodopseudomonas faecalis]|uniref:L-amino acid N-acyltransferase YncA n=1 Tax=Rhodopseudomonas faecalis TaxID=99655 RepID=A0A318TDR6_9BRAD|nr:GNAT family N-acetyltransferase [Rhodopseudomonas faecalis]PYF01980.1 L-amino acid N-acyltransferase YncA [Rhodopseudomonas faecalis]TAH65212.1 MAG: GNAT family N-acetyltransferase [Rhodopseudomonas palustris]
MTGEAITIRPAKRADVVAIVKLLADDPLGQNRELVVEPLPASYYKAFDAMHRAHHIQMMVAEDADGQVVGCLQLAILPGLSSQGASRGIIEDVRVVSDRRSQGVGERLVRWAIGEALANGCKLLELFTHESRVDAQRFYKRLGFQPSHVGMTMRF